MKIIKINCISKKEELTKNTENDGSKVGGSELANKETTNNEDSHDSKSEEVNKDSNIFDKDKNRKKFNQCRT